MQSGIHHYIITPWKQVVNEPKRVSARLLYTKFEGRNFN